MKDKLGVAVVGLDNWYHAYPFSQILGQLPGAQLVAISDSNPDKARRAAERFGAERWSVDHEAVIDDPAVDAIVLTTYTSSHAELGERAARLGKHILCDKPIEVSVERADRLLAAVRGSRVAFTVAFTRRWSAPYLRARELIRAGAIGEPTCAIETGRWPLPRVEPESWEVGWYAEADRSGGGAFLDHAVHLVDALRFLLDDEVAEVQGTLARLVHTQLAVEDFGVATLRFRRGAVATVESTWTVVPPGHVVNDLYVAGTKGDLIISRSSPQLVVHAETPEIQGVARLDFATGPIISVVAGHSLQVDLYRAVVETFLDAARTGAPVPATGLDGREATRICAAIYEAAASRRAVELTL